MKKIFFLLSFGLFLASCGDEKLECDDFDNSNPSNVECYCDHLDCQNGGAPAVDLSINCYCDCPPGWEGPQCTVDVSGGNTGGGNTGGGNTGGGNTGGGNTGGGNTGGGNTGGGNTGGGNTGGGNTGGGNTGGGNTNVSAYVGIYEIDLAVGQSMPCLLTGGLDNYDEMVVVDDTDPANAGQNYVDITFSDGLGTTNTIQDVTIDANGNISFTSTSQGVNMSGQFSVLNFEKKFQGSINNCAIYYIEQ